MASSTELNVALSAIVFNVFRLIRRAIKERKAKTCSRLPINVSGTAIWLSHLVQSPEDFIRSEL